MKVAIMQPYIFPYIGYFQLINSTDIFIFYDDVNFIKSGWINRNKILINGKENYFTIPLENISSYTLINETKILNTPKTINKLLKSIEQNYKKAPYFDKVYPLITHLLTENRYTFISELAAQSIIEVCKYLGIEKKFLFSSKDFPETKSLERADRLIEITQRLNSNNYINPIGGTELYNKDYFKEKGVSLQFIKPISTPYKQFNEEFIPWLSIIDVLMFNNPSDIKKMLDKYELI